MSKGQKEIRANFATIDISIYKYYVGQFFHYLVQFYANNIPERGTIILSVSARGL
jgi:hypothetical protein